MAPPITVTPDATTRIGDACDLMWENPYAG
jgi:hypothetical protein